MSEQADLLKVIRLSVALGHREVLADVRLTLGRGEFVAIVGPNGAGKTTLLRAIAGLVPWRGEVVVDGRNLSDLKRSERARTIAYLPQGHVFHWPIPVAEAVALGRLPLGAGADLSAADREAVARAMEATGVTAFADRPVTTLSGGERARVALARVLATEARIVLADEPTTALDPRYQLVVLDILRRHADNGGGVLAILHDLGLAARRADRVVVIDAGHVVADGAPRDVLTRARLAETFGVKAQIVTLVDAPVVIPWSVN
jgi:iron complex transport system ATP-binding protein